MKASYFLFLLILAGRAEAGEVQWGESTTFKSKEDSAYSTQAFKTKDMSPDEFSKGAHGSFFDKSFATQSDSAFDKDYNVSDKNYKTVDLDFDKIYGTKDIDFNSKVSSLNDQTSSLKLNDHPWSSKPPAYGFDKQIPNKEYTGPESKIVGQDMTAIYNKLNENKKIPDRDFNIDEVRGLVNTGELPTSTKASVKAKTSPSSVPPSSLPAP